MRYELYKKGNTVALLVLIGFQLLVIAIFLYAVDFFRKPNFLGYILITAALLKTFQLITDYRKSRLERK
jgi:hypothetical protein